MSNFTDAVKKSLDEQSTFEETTDDNTASEVTSAGDSEDELSIPEWASLPDNLKIPPGRQVMFLRFKANWTQNRTLGDRHCVIWSLSTADEQHATSRAQGNHARFMSECAKQMIRAFDGKIVDWTGASKKALDASGRSRVDQFWEEIGPKCRSQITAMYMKLHHLSMEDEADFFTSCVAVRSTIGG